MILWLQSVLRDTTRPVTIACWIAASLALAAAGPFDTTTRLEPVARLIFWSAVAGLSIVLSYAIVHLARRLLPDWSRLALDIVVVPVFAIVFTPLLSWLIDRASDGTASERFPIPLLAGLVLLTGAALVLVRELVAPSRAPAPPAAPADPEMPDAAGPAPTESARLMGRLPEDRRGALLALSAADHYTRVLTDKGETSVLLRFSDALDEVASARGLRVHRSHWVALDAVAGQRREGVRIVLILNDGTEIPVSRSYRDAVARAGLT